MAPNELIHCDIAKMNFSFSMVSALMNKQLRKYEIFSISIKFIVIGVHS